MLGLNDDGQLALSTLQGGLIYQNGTYTSLPAVTGFTVDPEGINDSGEIVGTLVSTSTTSFLTEGFTYQNGSYTVFSPPNSAGQTQARAVNSSGIVSGTFADSSAGGDQAGYTYDPSTGVFTDIIPSGSTQTIDGGINSAGQVVGFGLNRTTGIFGFEYQNGNFSALTIPGFSGNNPRGINDAGTVTGFVSGPGFSIESYVQNSGGAQILNDPNAGTGTGQGTFAEAINNSGQIAGKYIDANNDQYGFLATPVTLPNGTTAQGAFAFDVSVAPDDLIYIDPAAATGYQYEIGTGDPDFQSVVLPIGVGNNLFSLSLCDGTSLGSVAGGATYQFGAGGVSCFDVTGIPASAGFDPSNDEAFVTGLTFTDAGEFTGTMTPLATSSVPEPGSLFLMFAGLLGLVAVSLRKRTQGNAARAAYHMGRWPAAGISPTVKPRHRHPPL